MKSRGPRTSLGTPHTQARVEEKQLAHLTRKVRDDKYDPVIIVNPYPGFARFGLYSAKTQIDHTVIRSTMTAYQMAKTVKKIPVLLLQFGHPAKFGRLDQNVGIGRH